MFYVHSDFICTTAFQMPVLRFLTPRERACRTLGRFAQIACLTAVGPIPHPGVRAGDPGDQPGANTERKPAGLPTGRSQPHLLWCSRPRTLSCAHWRHPQARNRDGRRAGFENINSDIMHNCPVLIEEGRRATHISAPAKIEPDSAFGRTPPEGSAPVTRRRTSTFTPWSSWSLTATGSTRSPTLQSSCG